MTGNSWKEELDDMIKISLQFGKVLPLEMKIQVRKVAGGAEISTWTMVPEAGDAAGSMLRRKPEEQLPPEKRWGVQIA